MAAAISALFANDFGARGKTRVHEESWSGSARAARPAGVAPVGSPGGSGALAARVSLDKLTVSNDEAPGQSTKRLCESRRNVCVDQFQSVDEAPKQSTKGLCLSQSAAPAIITAELRSKTPDASVRTGGSWLLPPATRRGDQEVLCCVLCVCAVLCMCVCVEGGGWGGAWTHSSN